MAGMDWFRWHHGSVTDPKFALVARKAGASVPDVLAVWAYILETASQSVERGDFGIVDCEALDCVFGFPNTETRTADILKAMQDRDLTTGTRIAAWEKRQPKREREDATNADRQATFRAKQNQVTPDNTNDNQKTPREDKSREDKKKEKEPAALAFVLPEWIPGEVWAAFLEIRKTKKAKNTPYALGLLVKTLEQIKAAGHDPIAAINASIKGGWSDVYAPKAQGFAKPDPTTTVPSKPGRDPELSRLENERGRAVPMPAAIREAMKNLKQGIPA